MRKKITPEQLAFFEKRCDGRCEICGSPQDQKRKLALDHNHANGNLRGLLCTHCNLGLGSFRDDPIILLSAIEYLARRGDGTTPVLKSLEVKAQDKIAIRRAEREAWWKDKH